MISNVVYRQVTSPVGVKPLHMTLFVPGTDSEKRPAIIFFPGGGFMSANKDQFLELRYALARAGLVVASAEYRTIPAKYPAPVEDAKAAVRYLRAHAKEFGIDPDKIGVLGGSAGGYVVKMLGTTNGEKGWDKGDNLNVSSDVQTVTSLFGISDILHISEGLGETKAKVYASPAAPEALMLNGVAFLNFPGASVQADPEKTRNASAIGHVDGSEPPFLLMHGSADNMVSPTQSAHLFKALKEKKVDAQYVLVKGAMHGNLPWVQQPVIDRVVKFFKEKLGTPSTAPSDKKSREHGRHAR